MFNDQIHRFFFLLGTALIVVALPLSPFLLSLGLFVLAFNWLLEFRFIPKIQLLKKRPSIFFLLSFYIIHVVWLLNTNNMEYALHDLKIKLPLLSLPIIIGTTRVLNKKEFQFILHLFLATILVSTFISSAIYLGFNKSNIIDTRNISIFISHIRFALMVDLTCFIIVGLLLFSNNLMLLPSYLYITILLWLLFYVVFMGAFSGVIIFSLATPFLFYFWLKRAKSKKTKNIGIFSATLFALSILSYSGYSLKRYLSKTEININELPTHTLNGNAYTHYFKNNEYENENRIWLFISSKELKKEWNLRSDIKLGGKDKKNQSIRTTLIRYLTSLNYSKDSVGISKLSEQDIEMIENGYTNYVFKYKWALYPRLYEIFWEIEHYFKTGNPSGQSLTQRLEFARNGIAVAKRFFLLGTGTGDVNDEVMLQYKLDNSVLKSNLYYRPHNQFLTLFIAFGCVGFCLLVGLLITGILKEKANIDFFFLAFILISLFSMISEDTLETQAGASFFAFFLTLFLLGRKTYN